MSENQDQKLYLPSDAAVKAARISGMAAYDRLVAEAAQDYTGYWGTPGSGADQLEEALHPGVG